MLADAFETYLAAETAASDASLTWEVTLTRARAAWTALLLGRATIAHELIESCFRVPYDRPWMMATSARSREILFIAQACGDERRCSRAPPTSSCSKRFLPQRITTRSVRSRPRFFPVLSPRRRQIRVEFQALLELAISRLRSPDCGWTIFPLVAAHGSDSAIRRATELPRALSARASRRRSISAVFCRLTRGAARCNSVVCDRHSGEAQLLFEDFGCDYYATRCAPRVGRALRRGAAALSADGGRGRRAPHRASARSRASGRPRRSYEASRERREILQLLLAGLTTGAAIAERLGVFAAHDQEPRVRNLRLRRRPKPLRTADALRYGEPVAIWRNQIGRRRTHVKLQWS